MNVNQNVPVVIFALDNQSGENVGNFYKYLNEECHLTDKQYVQCVGCYKNIQEVSFLMSQDLFYKHVMDSDWTIKQESFLMVDRNSDAVLMFQKYGRRVSVGKMVSVPRAEAMEHDAWIYRSDIKTHFVCKKENKS